MQDQSGTATGFSEILENYIFNQVHDHARVCTFARSLARSIAISHPFIVIYLCIVHIFLPWDTKFYMICACVALSRLESANVEIRKWILLVGKWAKRQERRPHIKSKTTPSNANKIHRKEKKKHQNASWWHTLSYEYRKQLERKQILLFENVALWPTFCASRKFL